MARTPMVTRTFQTTTANVLCLDITNGESFVKAVTLSGVYTNDNKTLKAAAKVIETETIKAVHIVSTTNCEQLRGMSEQKFIEMSEVLLPRTKKSDEADTEKLEESETE